MAETLTVISTRSTTRAYKEETLTKDQQRILIEAGLKAPTARNEQEIHISMVRRGTPILDEIQEKLHPDSKKLQKDRNANNFYYDAPVVFILSGPDSFRWSAVDAGIAVENMHLAATDMGLGSVIIGCIDGVVNGDNKEYYSKKLAIPKGNSFQIALAVGHPNMTKEPHTIDYFKNVSLAE